VKVEDTKREVLTEQSKGFEEICFSVAFSILFRWFCHSSLREMVHTGPRSLHFSLPLVDQISEMPLSSLFSIEPGRARSDLN
jgi:hypothetical protein